MLFLYVRKQTYRISGVGITQKVDASIMRKLRHIFFVKTEIFVDFQMLQ